MCYIINVSVENGIPKGTTYTVEIKNLLNPTSIAQFGVFKIAVLMKYEGEENWSYISRGLKDSTDSV